MTIQAGASAPAFVLPDLDGAPRSLHDLTASGPVVLAFFKTSCPTCRLAMPVIGELQRRYGDALQVVGVTQTAREGTRPWLAEVGFDGPVLDDEQDRFAVSRSYDLDTVPTLVLVDGGRVTRATEGWDRDAMNGWAAELGERTGRTTEPVRTEGDGRPVFKPG
ncbi:MAG TPA: TlpA disulfide reductase family protein [Acidimicrobiales bacterium]|nr:TlpA disulfide reductase family protein [Acidimicrobiales bacterium]